MKLFKNHHTVLTAVKAQLDGAWLGSFYIITDVIDKKLYSNAPCIRPGAARLVIGRARLLGSPQKRFFHDPQRDSARSPVAATRGLQSTRQAGRRRTTRRVIHNLGLWNHWFRFIKFYELKNGLVWPLHSSQYQLWDIKFHSSRTPTAENKDQTYVYTDLDETGLARRLQAPCSRNSCPRRVPLRIVKNPLLRRSNEPRWPNHKPRRARPDTWRVWIRFFGNDVSYDVKRAELCAV
jgi:hypothetical protein